MKHTDTAFTVGDAASGRIGADEATPLVSRVCAALADGQFHSGEELARTLGVTRSSVWKAVKALRELGATLHAVRNRGYRLASAGEALEAEKIRESIPASVRERVRQIDVAWSVGSTNTVLLDRPHPPIGACDVMLAEYQTAGRGRRGRAWVAPPGGSICLSMAWTFREVPRDLGALGLVVGVCELRALKQLGIANVRLKWPNDLLVEGRKLGGILIELRAETNGPACVVIGVGINVALGQPVLEKIAETGVLATDLVSAGLGGVGQLNAGALAAQADVGRVDAGRGDVGQLNADRDEGGQRRPSRNVVTGALIGSCVSGLVDFEREGLRPFIEEWREADALRGQPVEVRGVEGGARGLARGIDLHGALLVETPHGLKRFISGDVTVRATE